MKQETTPPPVTSPARFFRTSSKLKDLFQSRAKSVRPGIENSSSKAERRSPVFGRLKPKNDPGRPQKCKERPEEPRVLSPAARAGPTRAATVAEQCSCPRRVRAVEGVEEKWRRELKEKIESSENLINNLESEVSGLRAELQKARGLNSELESKNRKLSEDLAAAEDKIAALSSRESQREREPDGKNQSPKFKDIQKLIASKLESPKVTKDGSNETGSKTGSRAVLPTSPIQKAQGSSPRKTPPPCPSLPPPPPPPPPAPSRPRAREGAPTPKTPATVEFYQFSTKQEGKKDGQSPRNTNISVSVTTSAHSSIVGEIQNRSAHLLAIKADIETKAELINGLIRKILAAAYTDIEDVLRFVNWVDEKLSSLADERAVLKHFNWPERKADAMREAAVEYRSLKLLEAEISSFEDDPDIPCGTAFKKMKNLLDKSEQSILRLTRLRNSVIGSYKEHKIPIGWLLDSGMVYKIKQASMKLAKAYVKRATVEFESVRRSDREATQEALLLQAVKFAYRAHQFVGGLDSETLCALEEIRQRVPRHLGGSKHLLEGIPLS